jgi:hypothetical protein
MTTPYQSASSGTKVEAVIEIYGVEEIARSVGMTVTATFQRRNGFAEVVINKSIHGKSNFTKKLEIPKSVWVSLQERMGTMFKSQLAEQPSYLGAVTIGMHFVHSPALILDLMFGLIELVMLKSKLVFMHNPVSIM